MESLRKLIKKESMGENMLVVLFVVFLVMGKPLPHDLSVLVDTQIGTITVVLLALSLFAYSNQVLAILGLVVAFEIIRRSTNYTGSSAVNLYTPSEEKKMSLLQESNKIPYTLEQEIVKNMAPTVTPDLFGSAATFSPVLDNLHDAASV